MQSRLDQLTELNALVKSSFKTRVRAWRWWQHCTNSTAYTKFSEIDQPRWKPVWSMSMRAEICRWSQEVSRLVEILIGKFYNKIGRKALGADAPAFLCRRTMCARFIPSRSMKKTAHTSSS